MNLEQRVEALEQAVKGLTGGESTIENGQAAIQQSFMQGAEITAANIKAAGRLYRSDKAIEVRDENGVIRLCCQPL